MLKGLPGLLTSNGTKKASYYIYQILSFITGDIICWGKHYFVIRMNNTVPASFAVFAYNYNNDIQGLCRKDTTPHQVRSVLNEFKDEIDLSFNVNLNPGNYTVMKYTFDRSTDIFSHFSSLDFPDGKNVIADFHELVPTSPYLNVYREDVRTNFHINFSMKGVGIQLAVITRKGDIKNDK